MAVSTPFAAPRTPRFAFLALLCGNVVLAFGPLLVRLADTGPLASGFWRLLIALPLLFLLASWREEGLAPARPVWMTVALAGFFFAADLGTWHVGILHTKIANATLFGNVSSLLLPLWGILVLRHRMAPVQWAGLMLAAAGAALLMGGSYELSPRNLTGDLFCLLAGVFYAAYILTVQRVRKLAGSWTVLTASTLAATLPILVFSLLLGEKVMPTDWTPLVMLAISSQVVGQGLMVYSMVWFSPLVVGLTLLVQPFVAALLGWMMFGEVLTTTDFMGASAIAVALVLVRLRSAP